MEAMKDGADLLKHLETATAANHERLRACPVCGEDVSTTGLPQLVYAFEPCDCGAATYTHLVERTYHRACFIAATTQEGGEQT